MTDLSFKAIVGTIFLAVVFFGMLSLLGYWNDKSDAPKRIAKDSVATQRASQTPEEQGSQITNQLQSMKAAVVQIHADKINRDLAIEIKKVTANSVDKVGLNFDLTRNSLTEIDLLIPYRESFFELEKTIKDQNRGVLPQWLKDNRDWQYLDKEWSR